VKVGFTAEAHRQIREIDAWWRANRHAAPDLFAREVDRALAALEESPSLGTSYESSPGGVRRLLLRRSHYHLYFRALDGGLFVVAIWSAYRGRGPRV
jgi:plasmid stabilization system protein ParE